MERPWGNFSPAGEILALDLGNVFTLVIIQKVAHYVFLYAYYNLFYAYYILLLRSFFTSQLWSNAKFLNYVKILSSCVKSV